MHVPLDTCCSEVVSTLSGALYQPTAATCIHATCDCMNAFLYVNTIMWFRDFTTVESEDALYVCR